MSIYIYLYIKTHQTTGLKYFGKTTRDDPYKYKGSGVHWMRHLEKHGNNVHTELLGCYTEEEVEAIALKFSRDNDIVNSKEWANLIEENGLDGGSNRGRVPWNKGKSHSAETRAKMSAAQKGRPGHLHSDEARAKISATLKGKTHSDETRAKMSAAQKGKHLSAEHKAKMSAAKKGKPLSAEHKAKISAARKGKPLSAETRAKMSAAQKGKPLSAEHKAKLSAAHKGKTCSAETKAKISAAKKGKPRSNIKVLE